MHTKFCKQQSAMKRNKLRRITVDTKIKTDLTETKPYNVDWIQMEQCRFQWQNSVKAPMKLWVLKTRYLP